MEEIGAGRENRTLFFARASHSASEGEVRALFAAFGRVEAVKCFRASAGGAAPALGGACAGAWQSSRGCGLVKMASSAEAEAAIQGLHETFTWPGMLGPLVVRWMKPDSQHRKRSRRSGPRGGRSWAAHARALPPAGEAHSPAAQPAPPPPRPPCASREGSCSSMCSTSSFTGFSCASPMPQANWSPRAPAAFAAGAAQGGGSARLHVAPCSGFADPLPASLPPYAHLQPVQLAPPPAAVQMPAYPTPSISCPMPTDASYGCGFAVHAAAAPAVSPVSPAFRPAPQPLACWAGAGAAEAAPALVQLPLTVQIAVGPAQLPVVGQLSQGAPCQLMDGGLVITDGTSWQPVTCTGGAWA